MILFAITSLLLVCFSLAAAQCYDQSGTVADGSPCNTGSLPTFCCPSGYACLSNGLCGKGSALQMGSCSDQSWSGGSCVKYCPVGTNNMAMCVSESTGNYCCETTKSTTCCSGQNLFQLRDFAKVSTVPFTTLTSSTSNESGTSTSRKKATKTSKTSKTSSDSSSTSSSSTSLTTSANPTASVTQVPTGPSTTGPAAGATTTPSTGGMTTGAKIGTGVGAVCGFAFLGFLVYSITFLLRRRHQDKMNAERARQIQAKVGGRISTNNDGGRDGGGLAPAIAGTDISRTRTPIARRPVASQYSGTEIINNENSQSTENSAAVPQRVRSTSPQRGYQHLANDDPNDPAYASRPPARSRSYGSEESYRPYRQPTLSNAHELGNIDPVAAVQYNQLPSHYSIYGSSAISPITPTQAPLRVLTPAQELAAARLRSNISPVGLAGIDS